MTNRMKAALNRFVRDIVFTGLPLVVSLAVVCSAQAQESVAPSGEGTEASPYQISQLGHLVWMGEQVEDSGGEHYALQNDIDASDTTNWNSGAGFAPIGTDGADFMGVFDGNGKVIRNLNINRPGEDHVGLFGKVGSSGEVRNVGLTGGSVTGGNYVGGLVGANVYGLASGCYATGPVTGGGLVGGLVGLNQYGSATNCHATGPVTGGTLVGGLVGLNQYGLVSNCYASGSATGSGNYVGGLAGGNDQSGGLVIGCYATGAVTGNTYVGGLVGANSNGGSVDESYATGGVTGNTYVGGLLGYNDSAVSRSYWDTETTGWETSAGGTGRSTVEMKQQATFEGWDFENVWRMTEDVTYPFFGPQSGQFCFAASAYSATEGVKRKVLVRRINGTSGTVSVDYVMKAKTALPGKDYTAHSGTLIWTNGQSASMAIKIPILADRKTEGNETFQILLKNPVGATLTAPAKTTVTILAN